MTEDQNLVPEDVEITDPGMAIDMVQDTLEDFLATADVSRVYGAPIENGDTLIIPTAEVVAGMGFGAGYGVGPDNDEETKGIGGGGGGGGRVFARPVAVIVSTPEGVRVDPVIDPTKIALAAFTTFGFVMSTLFRMVRMGKSSD
jgi:uncharacterized spore protein YtfJ